MSKYKKMLSSTNTNMLEKNEKGTKKVALVI